MLPFLHPGKAATTAAGWLGELHPALLDGTWGVFELDLDELTAPIPERILYDDVITFPPLRQDIAVVVAEEVEAAALVDAALEAGAPELREARVFDVYRGDQVGRGPQVGRASTSRCRRPTGRCPTTTPPSSARASSRRSSSASAPSCAARR